MGGISEEAIRERAYHIWVREGYPQGREYDHWVQAQIELEAEARGNGIAAPRKARAAAPKRTAKAAPAPAKAPRASTTRSGRAKKT